MPSLRKAIRRARALLYWGLRPHELSWSILARGGRPLLEDLAELRRLQDVGRRALATTGVSPYVLVLDRGAGELRCEVRLDTDPAGDVLEMLPEDLSWMRDVSLDLDDRWLVPSDRPDRSHMRLEGLSAVLRERPDMGRRLIAGGGAWCRVARVAEPT